MSQVANDRKPPGRSWLPSRAGVAALCFALMASCSSSSGPRRATIHASTPTTARPTTTTTAALITYRVKRGDTLTSIASRFRVSSAVIIFVNRLADPNHLVEGQELQIPPPPPLALAVTPPQAESGAAFQLDLKGAKASETITFEIDSPKGKYKGRPHLAGTDGAVTATYQTSVGDPPGTYTVVATGNQGTLTEGTFRVLATTTTPT